MLGQMTEGRSKSLPLIIKTGVGFPEALGTIARKALTPKCRFQVVHAAVGGISESDVNLAIASKAVIIGFNARARMNRSGASPESNSIDIRYYSIIYDAVDDIRPRCRAPERHEQVIGTVDIQRVQDHQRSARWRAATCSTAWSARILGASAAQARVIWTGELDSLKRFQGRRARGQAKLQCGLSLKNYNDIEVGDQLEIFEVQKEVARWPDPSGDAGAPYRRDATPEPRLRACRPGKPNRSGATWRRSSAQLRIRASA